MKTKFLWLIVFLFFAGCNYSSVVVVNSPNQNLKATFKIKKNDAIIHIKNKNSEAVKISAGNFKFDQALFPNGYTTESVHQFSKDTTWKPVYGERAQVSNHFNGIDITLGDAKEEDHRLHLVARVYDDGVAFRYKFDFPQGENPTLKKENTRFTLNGDYDAWVTNRAQGRYDKKPLSKINKDIERPLVIEQNNRSYLALGEAALVDYARMKFSRDPEDSVSLVTQLDSEVDLKKAHDQTSWRYVMVADSSAHLLQNNDLVLNLNRPNQLADVTWIKPGKVIREVTLTTQGGLACVDFAAQHNLQYVEFDAGWYGPESSKNSDASTITVDPRRSSGPLDLHKIIEYGKQKGVGIILYVNHLALEQQMDELFPLYEKWGVKGLKFGFVNVGSQKWTSWLHKAVRKAAEYHLMVDIHDEYRPTGYSRTYPNLMTQEGIRGDEESPSLHQTLATLFTRMMAGAGDYTNCFFTPRVSKDMGGKTAQMAKAVMLYSPWQFLFWYDRPQASPHKTGGAGSSQSIIKPIPALSFYEKLPTVWDDSRIIEGNIGKFATVARKSGDAWFIGSLTAQEARTVKIPLKFLEDNSSYEATIYYQDKDALEKDEVEIRSQDVDKKSVIEQELMKDSGVAVIMTKR